MKSFRRMKRKAADTFAIMVTFFQSKFAHSRRLRRLRRSPKFWLAFIVILIAAGYFAGTGGVPFLDFLRGKGTGLTGLEMDGSYLYSSFEHPKDVNVLKKVSSQAIPSTQQAADGSWSIKVSFTGGSDVSALVYENIMRENKGQYDWSSFSALHISLLNPGYEALNLTVQVKDVWGKAYSQEIVLPPGDWAPVKIPVELLSNHLNIKKINEISVSKNSVAAETVFFLDNLRLLPPDFLTTGSGGTRVAGKPGPMDYEFNLRKNAWKVYDPQVQGEVVRIPFIIRNETATFCWMCPIEGGIPMPMGELRELDRVRLRNSLGEDLPFQTKALAHWPDGSIKWVRVHFKTTLGPAEGTGFFLEYGPNLIAQTFDDGITVEEAGDSIKINTGPMEAVLNKKHFYLFESVSIDVNQNKVMEPEEVMTSKAAFVLQARNKEFRTDLDDKTYKLEIEEQGKQKIVVKGTGWYENPDGERFCQAVVRWHFYHGKADVKVVHTWIYTGYPANHIFEDYKHLALPENETVQSISLRIPFDFSNTVQDRVLFGQASPVPIDLPTGDKSSLVAVSYDTAQVTQDGGLAIPALVPRGWMDLSNGSKGIGAAVRHFRENFPKAFRVDRSLEYFQIDLWPAEAGDLDLQTTPKAEGTEAYGRGSAFGLGKTHEILFYFHPLTGIDAKSETILTAWQEPIMIRTNPYWIDATGALGRLYPADPKYATEEKMLDRLFEWAARHPRFLKWYGIWNFGDTQTWLRNEDEENKYPALDWNPTGRWGWYNCEGVGTHTGALLQFARTGEAKYFEFGENMARHIMDVDTVHYDTITNDKRISKLLDSKYSQPGAIHRHNGDHWGGRTDEASHTNITGLLLYHYLTGDERALDVAKESGEYFLKKPFTYIGYPHVAPNRAIANALWGHVLLYQTTGDERHKEAADKLVKIFIKGQEPDGSFLENYNPLFHTWSGEKHNLYMSLYLVGAFISYHEMTGDIETREMLLKLVRYIAGSGMMGDSILHGIAYAYRITRDPAFISMAEAGLKQLLDHQVFTADAAMDGLIYDKPIYHRPMVYLSTVPYVFAALEENFVKKESWQ